MTNYQKCTYNYKVTEKVYSVIYNIYIMLQQKKSSQSLVIRTYKRIAEKILIFYFHVNPLKPFLYSSNKKGNFIVSLTTFPERIDKVYLVIESILYQTHKPDRICLWLYEGEFPEKKYLPKKLLNLERRGLEIRFCSENLMPHKKYLYTLQENWESNLITVDDDMLYPPCLIETLIKENQKHPKSIIAPITREIKTQKGTPISYSFWSKVNEDTIPDFKYLTMGGGGTLFPPGSFDIKIFDKNMIKSVSLYTDDLWLKIMTLLNETKVIGLGGTFNYTFLPVFHKGQYRLMDANILKGNNDQVFKELIIKYNIDLKSLIINE